MTAVEDRLAALRGTANPDVTQLLQRALAACAPAPAPSRPAPTVEVSAPAPSRHAPFICPGCGAFVFAPLAESAHVCPGCGREWAATAEV